MNQYMLLLHEKPASYASLGPADMQAMIERYKAWSRGLAERGLLAGGEKLADEGGKHLRISAGQPLASDGAYAEAHDIVGGYFTILAESDAHAVELAQGCPHLHGSNWIEIRRIEPVP